ncbi:uncharacterized protein LOC117505662 [Thalassophryne amazonica]|uniref:uncharacterized protein LOC117505662 n=1 Tax=Thalassophryne amazonica TaxID=390379 RepID=UPI0014709208|nr:uncharacterized protein LOC117505662 [Thalassophryne amazonica]
MEKSKNGKLYCPDVSQDKKVPKSRLGTRVCEESNGATSLSAAGNDLPCESTQLDNPSDQHSSDPGLQQQQPQRPKRKLRKYATVTWTIEEKKTIFYCFAYSRHEKWGRRKKAVFEEKIKEADLPVEKKEATTTAKLQSIASQVTKYLTAEDIEKIKEEAHNEVIKDHQSMEEGKRLEFEGSQWKREEEWVLLWAIEYAKIKYTNQRERSKEWQRIFYHHCPSKKDIPRGRLTTQKHNFIVQKHEAEQMVKEGICPLTQPIEHQIKPASHTKGEVGIRHQHNKMEIKHHLHKKDTKHCLTKKQAIHQFVQKTMYRFIWT